MATIRRPLRIPQGDCQLRLRFVNLVPVFLKAASPGGAERQVLLLAFALRERGHEVFTVTPGSWRGAATVEGIRVLLEAWSRGVPDVSLNVDPDGLLSGARALGFSSGGSVATIAGHIRTPFRDHAPAAQTRQLECRHVSAFRSFGSELRPFEGILT